MTTVYNGNRVSHVRSVTKTYIRSQCLLVPLNLLSLSLFLDSCSILAPNNNRLLRLHCGPALSPCINPPSPPCCSLLGTKSFYSTNPAIIAFEAFTFFHLHPSSHLCSFVSHILHTIFHIPYPTSYTPYPNSCCIMGVSATTYKLAKPTGITKTRSARPRRSSVKIHYTRSRARHFYYIDLDGR